MPHRPATHRPRQRGAALLTAMIVVTLVATLASAMYWRQWRSVQIESAERSRAQSSWILTGALDWARLILSEDARAGGPDHLSEPWATPLAEARLSTFLAADEANTDSGPEAFLAGRIVDAQSRFNLRNLVRNGEPSEPDMAALKRLCEQLNIDSGVAQNLAMTLVAALPATDGARADAGAGSGGGGPRRGTGSTLPPGGPGTAGRDGDGTPRTTRTPSPQDALLPPSTEHLRWLGLGEAESARLAPYVTLLPRRTPVNLNTAPREVIAAVIPGLDIGSADRIVQMRQRSPLKSANEALPHLPPGTQVAPDRWGVSSSFFEVYGRMRIEQRVVEERSLVERRGRGEVVTLRRERANFMQSGGFTS